MTDEMIKDLAEAHDYHTIADVASIVDNDGLLFVLQTMLPHIKNPMQEHIVNKLITIMRTNPNAILKNTPTLLFL